MVLSPHQPRQEPHGGARGVHRSTWNPRDKEIGRLYAGYLKALTDASAVDFDDLLLKTVELFDKAPAVRERYARRFRFAMIDEYQDTNRPQYLLVKQLVSVHGNLCVVGDPDQSIYKWRGADVKNILDFEHDFPDAVTVKLERNYRSTQVILDAASAVVRHNRGRKDKVLWTDQAGGAPIVTYRGADELDEADFIVRTIRRGFADAGDRDRGGALSHQRAVARGGGRAAPGRHPVRRARRHRLLRAQGDQGRARLPEAGAEPARRRGAAPGDQRAAARHRQGRDGRARAARYERAATSTAAAAGRAAAVEAATSLWAKLDAGVDPRAAVGPPARRRSQAFRDMLLEVTAAASRQPVSTVLGLLLDRSGYLRELREERSEEADGRIENLMELVSAAREYEAGDPEPACRRSSIAWRCCPTSTSRKAAARPKCC